MTTKGITLFILSSLWMCSLVVAEEKIVVIVNAQNQQVLSSTDIKNIYNDNVINWQSGMRITVYDLPVKSAVREKFSRKILGSSARDAASEWANKKITNAGKNPPITKPESVVVDRVTKDRSAIGYVSAAAVVGKEHIRILLTLE